MRKFSPVVLFASFMIWASANEKLIYPDFDNQNEVAKIINTAQIGEWNLFSNKSLPFDEFRQKQGFQYLRTDQNTFSGCYIQLDTTKKIRNLRYFSNGLLDGPIITWSGNGRKTMKGSYKNGKKVGEFSYWSNAGNKLRIQNYKENQLDGISIYWYQNGQKSLEQVFRNGTIITAIGWKPDGSRCPSTRVYDGTGMVVFYDESIDASTPFPQNSVKAVEYYENGNPREEGYYRNQKKHGIWIYYRPDGSEHFRCYYTEGKRQKTKFSKFSLP